MTSEDADLRSGRRLETGRRSESIIYASVVYLISKYYEMFAFKPLFCLIELVYSILNFVEKIMYKHIFIEFWEEISVQ
jgi:hypothetical protein